MFRNTAHVYDLIYEASGKNYATEASDLHQLIRARQPAATSLLDVACGTGGHLIHLRQWYNVVGVDLDAGMLQQARSRLPDIALIEGDMRTFRLDRRFDAVICMFSSIGYMSSRSELDEAIATMAGHLNAGGVLIVDGWVRPDDWRGAVSTHVETAESDSVKVARCGIARRDGDKTRLEMHHLIATVDGIDYVVDRHELTLFHSDDYSRAFARAGLTVGTAASPYPDRDRFIGTRD